MHPFLGLVLRLYVIQLHHLTPDCITHISCFITLYEGYLGINSHLGWWCSLFSLVGRIKGEGDTELECGVVKVVPRRSDYPDLKLLAASAGWERSFFYCPELPVAHDGPIFPPFQQGVPPSRHNWNLRRLDDPNVLELLNRHLTQLVEEGLTGLDLLTTWMIRRIQPIQIRVHSIYDWSPSGHCTQMTTQPLALHQLAGWVRSVSELRVGKKLKMGRVAFCSCEAAPLVS